MKNKIVQLLSIMLALVLPLAAITGCSEPEKTSEESLTSTTTKPTTEESPTTTTSASAPENVTIIDSFGREVTVPQPVERICFSYYGVGEALTLLSAWENVVSVDCYTLNYSNEWLYPNAADLPVISGELGLYDVDIEKVLELQPDVFITAAEEYALQEFEHIVEFLEPDIPVVALDIYGPDTMVENIEKLGKILGYEEEAAEFNRFYSGISDLITNRTASLSDEQKPEVLVKVTGWSQEDISTFTNEYPGMTAQVEGAGGINIAGDLTAPGGFVQNIDPEWVIEQNPNIDILVAAVSDIFYPGVLGFNVNDESGASALLDEITSLDMFSDSKAVQDQKVYMHLDHFTGTPRHIIIMAYRAKWFQPELFEDMNPKALHQEYLTRFLGADFDLDEGGLFFYPEP